MKTSVKKILTIEIIMLITIITGFFIPYLFENERYVIFLVVALILNYFAVGFDFSQNIKSREILKTLLICLMAFFIFSYLAGLFIGFNRTIYSFGLTNLANNIAPTIITIVLCEILRYQFIKKSNKNKIVVILSGLIFTLIDICIAFTYYNLGVQSQLYEFAGLIVMCGITKNILVTVMSLKYDYVVPITYRLIMELYEFIIPIVPGFGPYVKSIIMIIYPIILTFVIYKGEKLKINNSPKDNKKHEVAFIVITTILLIIVALNSGLFTYQTLVVGSNSMQPEISKGDVVLIRKIDLEDNEKLKKNDILAFRNGSKIIVHRVYKAIEKNDGTYYITKGDNNNQADQGVVEPNNVLGKVLLKIKKIGLPSIWLNEMFK